MVEIATERLSLRRWRDEDLRPYARICADPEVMRYIGGGATLSREESEAQVSRFEGHWEERGFGLWAMEEMASGSLIGFEGLGLERIISIIQPANLASRRVAEKAG